MTDNEEPTRDPREDMTEKELYEYFARTRFEAYSEKHVGDLMTEAELGLQHKNLKDEDVPVELEEGRDVFLEMNLHLFLNQVPHELFMGYAVKNYGKDFLFKMIDRGRLVYENNKENIDNYISKMPEDNPINKIRKNNAKWWVLNP